MASVVSCITSAVTCQNKASINYTALKSSDTALSVPALKSAGTETLISVGSDTTFVVDFRLPCHPRKEKTLIGVFNSKVTIKSLICHSFSFNNRVPFCSMTSKT